MVPLVTMLMVLSCLAGCIDSPSGEEKDPVVWIRPDYITIDHFAHNDSTSSMDLTIRLWDIDGYVTEWDGDLTVMIKDDNLDIVYNSTWPVRTKDYRTEVSGSSKIKIYDTFLEVSVPVDQLNGSDPTATAHPEWSWDAEAAFTFDGERLESLPQWLPPYGIYARDVELDTENNEYDLVVRLDVLDYMMTTKWSGDLTITLTDGLGVEMYNNTRWVDAREFEVSGRLGRDEIIEWDVDAELHMSIPIDDIQPSHDIISNSQGLMKLNVLFDRSGFTMQQKGSDHDPQYPIEIPDHLIVILENVLPVAKYTGPSSCWARDDIEFNASASNDPDGKIESWIWDWGDGQTQEIHTWRASHFFIKPGKYNVTLTVRDNRGGENTTSMAFEVKPYFTIELLSAGWVNDSGDRHNQTYVNVRVTNQSPQFQDRPSGPQFRCRDREGDQYYKFEVIGTLPDGFNPHESVDLTIYYRDLDNEYRMIPIDIYSIESWNNEWIVIPEELFQ